MGAAAMRRVGGPIMERRTTLALSLALLLEACAIGRSPQEQRAAVLAMHDEVLTELYRIHPPARAEIEAAPGYAVFSNANVNLVLASFSGGRGVVQDRQSGRQTFMKMAEAGLGLGLGLKDFRAVFVFRDHATLVRFVERGWEFGGHADAAAKVAGQGGAVGGELLIDGIRVYQITRTGLALQATVKGSKYWKDEALN